MGVQATPCSKQLSKLSVAVVAFNSHNMGDIFANLFKGLFWHKGNVNPCVGLGCCRGKNSVQTQWNHEHHSPHGFQCGNYWIQEYQNYHVGHGWLGHVVPQLPKHPRLGLYSGQQWQRLCELGAGGAHYDAGWKWAMTFSPPGVCQQSGLPESHEHG